MSGVAASASVTSKRRPNTWFIATNEAAMPAAVWKKRRRDRPCCRASRSLNSLSRASTSRCLAVCGTGMYSSLDTIWVGTGDGNDEVSAGSNCFSCSSLRNFMLSSRGLSWGRGHLDVQQTRGVDAEDCLALSVVKPGGTFEHADWIDFAHIGRIVGAHQDVVGAVLFDEIIELVVGVDQRIEINSLQIGRRRPMQLLAAIWASRRGVVDTPRIGWQKTAAMGDDELEVRIVA